MKNSEEQENATDFLSLFDCTVLQMLKEENFTKVSFISSTPGAGKTSLFRAFSPFVLRSIVSGNSNELKEIRKSMSQLGVISEKRVLLVSAILSCALNYSIIDEMFKNGRRKQVFFALLNYRIAIVLLRGIGHILDLTIEEYDRITFDVVPIEMASEEVEFRNGESLYQWACKGERDLCRYLDSERSEQLDISFVHTSLVLIKLFEATNILYDGRRVFEKSLIVLDDFHKLTEDQKNYISEAVYTLKTTTGVWFGQRLEGIKNNQIISMDGSLSRDYNSNIVIDNYWPKSQGIFYKMLENIADRRVKEVNVDNLRKYSSCISDSIDPEEYSSKLGDFIKSIRDRIIGLSETRRIYKDIISYIEKSDLDVKERSIWYECIRIKEFRRNGGQLQLLFDDCESVESFNAFVKDNGKSAWFYICHNLEIPFYAGFENLRILSSFNVQQFLVFAGEYYDCYRIKALDSNGISQNNKLTFEEQTEILSKVVKQRWDDMELRYRDIKNIRFLLKNIAKVGQHSRDSEKASYAGGAYTGIGISNYDLKRNMDNPRYSILIKTLGECLASNYLERREIYNGKTVVFYLSRWLCVFFKLPLAYGGWKNCDIDKAMQMCTINDVDYDEGRQRVLAY